jgi:hypothetical protein
MNAYKTYTQLDASGRLVLENLPFSEGALVEVVVMDQSLRPDEGAAAWKALMRHVQSLPQSLTLTDEEIAAEVEAVRSGG